jgi:NAD-dependent SIR2 family protein deacetylase
MEMELLATEIKSGRRVVFVTGAGLSCASGIKPYRATPDALWNVRDTKLCRIETFAEDPEKWYRDFWLPEYQNSTMLNAKPSAGHLALEKLRATYPNVSIVTQNVDGLHVSAAAAAAAAVSAVVLKTAVPVSKQNNLLNVRPHPSASSSSGGHIATHLAIAEVNHNVDDTKEEKTNTGTLHISSVERIVEAHGVVGDYRCLTPECVFHKTESFATNVGSSSDSAPNGTKLHELKRNHDVIPLCPACGTVAIPLVLMFDEEYTCHVKFQWKTVERWVTAADAVVFVGTSLSVGLTKMVQKWSTENKTTIYHFNLESPPKLPSLDILHKFMSGDIDIDGACKLTSDNGPHYIVGKCEHTIPYLASLC